MITPNDGKDVEKLDDLYLAGENENCAVTLEMSMAFSYHFNLMLTKQPSN